jgi:hypothetical protein
MEREASVEVSRKSFIASAAAGVTALAASALALPAEAAETAGGGNDLGIYGHGMVWNPTLPGVAGEVRLAFELWLDLEAEKGLGVAQDPLHPDWELYFGISRFERQTQPKGEIQYKLWGVVTKAAAAANVGLPVRIYAYVETSGESTAVGIALGDLGFGGAGILSRTSLRINPASLGSTAVVGI